MKKIMIAAAIVCAAAFAQAATVLWQSGNVFTPSDADGTYKTGKDYKLADAATAAMYLWVLTPGEYATAQSDGVWETYGGDLASADKSTSTHTGGAFEALSTTGHEAKDTVYAAVIITYTDAAGQMWYLDTTGSVTISDLGADGSLDGLGRYEGGDGGTQYAAWGLATAAAPEPTSGLLLLLGVAGLALKRRRA